MSKYVRENGRTVRKATLPVTSCEGCGACCRTMGTPPGFAAMYSKLYDGHGGYPVGVSAYAYPDDIEIWTRLKAERPGVEAELSAYYADMIAGRTPDRTAGDDTPCLWYDEATHRCRHYEYRPSVCRTAIEPGDEHCLRIRRTFRIPLPLA